MRLRKIYTVVFVIPGKKENITIAIRRGGKEDSNEIFRKHPVYRRAL